MNATFKEIRERLGMSQMDMAVKCGVSIPTITALEQDRLTSPFASTRRKLAEGYGVDIADIPCRRPEVSSDDALASSSP